MSASLNHDEGAGAQGQALLTQVKGHTDEDDQSQPGTKQGAEVDDCNHNVNYSGKDTEHNVAKKKNKRKKLHTNNQL